MILDVWASTLGTPLDFGTPPPCAGCRGPAVGCFISPRPAAPGVWPFCRACIPAGAMLLGLYAEEVEVAARYL